MNSDELMLSPELRRLFEQFRALQRALREQTWVRYRRINPFSEDLSDWKEKGRFIGSENVTIYDSTTVVGDVTIGAHTWVGPFCSLDGTGGLRIGRYCAISAGTHVQTHDTVRWALSGGESEYEFASVEIGDCCFIGVNAVITRGVSIGAHSLVAAGAVVTKSVSPYSIVGGVPARKIGSVELNGVDVNLNFKSGAAHGVG